MKCVYWDWYISIFFFFANNLKKKKKIPRQIATLQAIERRFKGVKRRWRPLTRQTVRLREGANGNWRRRWREMKWDRRDRGEGGGRKVSGRIEEGEGVSGEGGGVNKVFVTLSSEWDWKRSGRGWLGIKLSYALRVLLYPVHALFWLCPSLFLSPFCSFPLILFPRCLFSFFALSFLSFFPPSPSLYFPSVLSLLLVSLPFRHVYNPGDSDRCWWPDLWEQRQASVHTGAGPTVLLCGSPDRWVCLYIA